MLRALLDAERGVVDARGQVIDEALHRLEYLEERTSQ